MCHFFTVCTAAMKTIFRIMVDGGNLCDTGVKASDM
jgi:hypothetical protein